MGNCAPHPAWCLTPFSLSLTFPLAPDINNDSISNTTSFCDDLYVVCRALDAGSLNVLHLSAQAAPDESRNTKICFSFTRKGVTRQDKKVPGHGELRAPSCLEPDPIPLSLHPLTPDIYHISISNTTCSIDDCYLWDLRCDYHLGFVYGLPSTPSTVTSEGFPNMSDMHHTTHISHMLAVSRYMYGVCRHVSSCLSDALTSSLAIISVSSDCGNCASSFCGKILTENLGGIFCTKSCPPKFLAKFDTSALWDDLELRLLRSGIPPHPGPSRSIDFTLLFWNINSLSEYLPVVSKYTFDVCFAQEISAPWHMLTALYTRLKTSKVKALLTGTDPETYLLAELL